MARINVYDIDPALGDKTIVGWFDPKEAQSWDEGTRWDGSNLTSLVAEGRWAHETLYRTAAGRWVILWWSQYEGTQEWARYVTQEQAVEWLIASEYDAAEIEQITDTEVPEERGPGRPQVGDRPYKLVMPETMLASIDERADRDGVSRAEWIRRALAAALEG